MTVVKKSIFINAPLEKVHNFGVDPHNYVLYNASLCDPENINGNGEAGTTGDYKLMLLGKKMPITVKVAECNMTPDCCTTVTEISGSQTAKQITTGKSKDNGTEVTIELEYTPPGSIFGKLVDKIIIEKSTEKDVEQTLEKLKALCEAK